MLPSQIPQGTNVSIVDNSKAGQADSAWVVLPLLPRSARGIRVRFPFRIRDEEKSASGGGGGREGGRVFIDDAVHFLFVVEDVVDPLDGAAVFSDFCC